MATYTPGPWQVTIAADGDTYITGGEPREDGLNPLAAIDGFDDEAMANASLMAAAPDLLIALRRLYERCYALQETHYLPSYLLDGARRAIEKAEGEG